jgi:hypothetical protein
MYVYDVGYGHFEGGEKVLLKSDVEYTADEFTEMCISTYVEYVVCKRIVGNFEYEFNSFLDYFKQKYAFSEFDSVGSFYLYGWSNYLESDWIEEESDPVAQDLIKRIRASGMNRFNSTTHWSQTKKILEKHADKLTWRLKYDWK